MMDRSTQFTAQQTPLDMPRRLGGRLCLDFVNTVDPRFSPSPHDYLMSYPDLVAWSRYVDIVQENEARQLLQAAARRPAVAAAAFHRALALREALYQIFSAIIGGTRPVTDDVDTLNVVLSEGMTRMRLLLVGNGFAWTWSEQAPTLDRLLWPIARSAAELLISPELDRVRECPGDDGCGWLFVDMSRNHRRRWCAMDGCGNRAKARRHYERTSTLRDSEKGEL